MAALKKRAAVVTGNPEVYHQDVDPVAWVQHHIDKAAQLKDPYAVVVTIDRPLAEALLARNPVHWNRKVSPPSVQKWGQAMARGEWALNGETIIVSTMGELNDGQHRLQACAEFETSFRTIIVFGIERDTRMTLDQGKRRSLKDTLDMSGYTNTAVLSAAASCLLGYLRKDVSMLAHGTATPNQVLITLEEHPKLTESHAMGARIQKAFRISPAIFTALHYLLNRQSPDAAELFFHGLLYGTERPADPRQRLAQRMRDHATRQRRLSRPETVAITVKAWNFWRRGEDIGPLTFRQMGRPEDLPTIDSWTELDDEGLKRRLKEAK